MNEEAEASGGHVPAGLEELVARARDYTCGGDEHAVDFAMNILEATSGLELDSVPWPALATRTVGEVFDAFVAEGTTRV